MSRMSKKAKKKRIVLVLEISVSSGSAPLTHTPPQRDPCSACSSLENNPAALCHRPQTHTHDRTLGMAWAYYVTPAALQAELREEGNARHHIVPVATRASDATTTTTTTTTSREAHDLVSGAREPGPDVPPPYVAASLAVNPISHCENSGY
jgi:hypothetical protein